VGITVVGVSEAPLEDEKSSLGWLEESLGGNLL